MIEETFSKVIIGKSKNGEVKVSYSLQDGFTTVEVDSNTTNIKDVGKLFAEAANNAMTELAYVMYDDINEEYAKQDVFEIVDPKKFN